MSTSSCLTEFGQDCPTHTDEVMSTAVDTQVRKNSLELSATCGKLWGVSGNHDANCAKVERSCGTTADAALYSYTAPCLCGMASRQPFFLGGDGGRRGGMDLLPHWRSFAAEAQSLNRHYPPLSSSRAKSKAAHECVRPLAARHLRSRAHCLSSVTKGSGLRTS